MALKTKVKVGNITNLSDARYCAGMGVDMLGFEISEEKDRGINPVRFKEITDWVSGPEFVLELSGGVTGLDLEKYAASSIELPASKISLLNSLNAQSNSIITLTLKEWPDYKNELLNFRDKIQYLIVTDFADLDIGEVKQILSEIAVDFSVLLGISHEISFQEEYLNWPIAGLALNGSEETSPGIKDYDHLSSVLERLEVE